MNFLLFILNSFFNLGSQNSVKAERSQRLPVLCSGKHGPSMGQLTHICVRKFLILGGGSVGRLEMAHRSQRDVKQQI